MIPPAWARRPIVQGFALGALLPLLVGMPALLWGGLSQVRSAAGAYFLLPWFSLLALPAGLGAALLQRDYRDRQALWRLSSGLLLGGSAVGAFLLWATTGGTPLAQRVGLSLFGGVMLAGFWVWIGGFLSAYWAFERRGRRGSQAILLRPEPGSR